MNGIVFLAAALLMLCFAMALAYNSIIATKIYTLETKEKKTRTPREHYKTFDLSATKLEKRPEP